MSTSTGKFARLAMIAATTVTAVALETTPAALADTSATVRAKTQRMSAANLNSTQNGWYNAGDRITLVCSTRGQGVKGFFSFNIPNGGWDNLWYRTSDGNYVADVDIETGTLNVVAPDCATPSPPAPAAPSQSGAQLRVPLDGTPHIERGFGNGHDGIDYDAGAGTAVYAAGDGVVTFEGYGANNRWMTDIAGICILIKHSDKYTGYAHLSRTVINNGQHVSKGQLIGHTGATGVVSGPHLHFEVLPLQPNWNDHVFHGRIDPAPFL